MKHKFFVFFFIAVSFLVNQSDLSAQQIAPAYPLITHDPYFSIWSATDTLSSSVTRHWTGTDQSLTGLIQVDGDVYRFLGKEERQLRTVIPTSEEASYNVRYTETSPSAQWMQPGFDDASWKIGAAPAGDGNEAATSWKSHDLWTRRTFSLSESISAKLYLKINHDDNVEVFLNGEKIYEKIGWLSKFEYFPVSDIVAAKLKKQGNVLAIHVINTAGGQWLDAGLSEEVKRPKGNTVAAVQNNVSISATQTSYQFTCGKADLFLTFTSPLLLNDLDVLSRPVSYVTFKVRSNDGAKHRVKILLATSSDLAVNSPAQMVSAEKSSNGRLSYLKAGTVDQKILQKSGDDLRIDWGYLYVAVPDGDDVSQSVSEKNEYDPHHIANTGSNEKISGRHLSLNSYLHFPSVDDSWQEKFLMLGYDDLFSIQYFGQNLKPWWKTGTKTIETELAAAADQYKNIIDRCNKFDEELHTSSLKAGGEAYAKLCELAYRQSVAAHKLVKAPNGELLFLSKENFSNGCINTVDVTYPSAPLYLLYNPSLLEGMLNGIFYFSESGKYTKPYAAHDIGTYPLANGQVYGEGMPVKESGNMLILTAAVVKANNNAAYAKLHWQTLSTWANYLLEEGFDPANQLCTDDFAGHLARNANLSVKAIMGIEAYANLAQQLGYKDVAQKFGDSAKSMAQRWEKIANAGDHYALTFNDKNTWSQKYNMVWDKVLDFHLFPESIYKKEITFYLNKPQRYGLPLDSRKTYSKSDWIIWSACLSDNRSDFEKLIAPVYKYVKETSTRVPMSDWYETTDGTKVGFQARSVVGGYFMKVLMDKWKK